MSGSPTPVKTADDGGRSAIIYGFVISQTTYTIRDPLTQFITISVPSSTSSDTSSHSALGTTSNSTVSSLSISETTSKSIPSKTSSSKSSSTSHTGSPTSSHSSGHSSSKGVSGGAVAGIAVGVAVFASVVAFLLALFVLRSRRSRSYNERPYDSDNGRVTVLSKPTRDTRKGSRSANYELTKGPLAATGASKFDSDLPPSEDDYTIQNDIKGMLEQIVLHVDNYYNSTASKIPHEARVELESFSTSDSLPLIELLSDALSSHSVIQYCLTRQILNRISPHCDPASSFLPMSFVVLPSTLQKLETQKAMKSGMFDEAFSRWRVLSAYLYRDCSSDPEYLTHREHVIGRFVQSVSRAFSPWANPGKDSKQRTRHLTAIIQNAAEKGILLFSQPSTFEFHWGPSYRAEKRQLVVSPALLKVADENAQKLAAPQSLVSRSTVNI